MGTKSKKARERLGQANAGIKGENNGVSSQFDRDWGKGTAITSRGNRINQDNVAFFKARDSLVGLRRTLRSAETNVNKQPDNVFLQEETEKARQKLREAEAIIEAGYTEKF